MNPRVTPPLSAAWPLRARAFLPLRSLAFAGAIALSFHPLEAAAETAGQADAFVDHVGINIKSPSYGNYGLVYANTTLVESKLSTLGVRYHRVNAKDVDGDWAFFNTLNTDHGIKADIQVTWTFANLGSRLQTNVSAITSVEGPNETDNKALGWTYNGAAFAPGTINFQNDLYSLVKGSTTTQALPVIAPSVMQASDQSQLAGCSGDNENMHSYPGGGKPTSYLDSPHIADANLVFTPPKPIVATETGYHTALQATTGGGVTEKAQGKYTPRLLAEYWNRGVVRTYLYELFDEGNDQTNSELTYGILHNDGTAKPAFTALTNLLSLLREPGVSFVPGSFNFALSGNTTNVHHTLLQKSNGDFYLLLWQDVSVFNGSTKTDITNADVPVTLSFATPVAGCVTYRFDDAGNLTSSGATIIGNTVQLSVPDTVLIVKLAVGATTSTAPASPTGLTASAGNLGPVALAWNLTLGADSYNIKRATTATGPFTTIASGVAGNTYGDASVSSGAYFYAISAVNSHGESANSGSVAPNVIVDNTDASGVTITGSWIAGTSVSGYYGTNYLYTLGSGNSVQFTPTLLQGTYGVSARWTANANRDAAVPIAINSASGLTTLYVNQQANGGVWYPLGSFDFNAGTGGNAIVSTTGTTGYVVADAMEFIPSAAAPSAPANVVAAAGNGRITLTWSSTAGAATYNVKRATTSGGPYATIASGVTAAGYADAGVTNGTTYYYVVSAANALLESSNSSETGATPSTATLTVDNADGSGVAIAGTWIAGTGISGYYGTNYLYTNTAALSGPASVTFTPALTATGTYDVYVRWTAASNRATNAPFDIVGNDGTSTITVNEQTGNGTWTLLGNFRLGPTAGSVVARNTGGANGYVVADAVQFVQH